MTYAPFGGISTLLNGCVGTGCVQVQETYDYNNRLQPVRIQFGTSGSPSALDCLVYNYYPSLGQPGGCAIPAQTTTGNNGSVIGYLDQDSYTSSYGHTAAYSYDVVNRLSTAVATPQQTGGAAYNLTFSYDRFGNMTCVTSGSTNGLCPNWTFNTANNQINTSGFSYDAAGNLTGDGTHTYQWDAEARLTSIDSGTTRTYTYNALGEQVEATQPSIARSELVFDPAGKLRGWYDGLANVWSVSGVFHLSGRQIGVYSVSNNATYFSHDNALGSSALVTDQTGTVVEDWLYYPWGQQWIHTGYVDFYFAGFDWEDDPLSIFPTLFRQYSGNQGRWLSPDPLAGDITNPQSLNRYAYVRNNPATLTDPLGLITVPPGPDCRYVGDQGDGEPMFWCESGVTGTSGFIPPSGVGGDGNSSAGGSTPPPPKPKPLDVSKTWQRTFPCGQDATQLMANVQSDFSHFANKFSGPLTAEFEPGPINKGDTFAIFPGLQTTPGFSAPVKSLVVTVSQQSANGWVFTTDPTRHFFNGTVAFSAADAGNGNVNFMITVNANFTSFFNKYVLGLGIQAGENSTWNNLLNNVQSYCGSGGVQ